MPTPAGPKYAPQQPGAEIAARTINQTHPAVEGLTRLSVGRGLAKQVTPGLIPHIRQVGVQTAYAKVATGGIAARDATNPALIKPGVGNITVHVRTAARTLRPRNRTEVCENLFAGTVAANTWIMVVKVDGVWSVFAVECP